MQLHQHEVGVERLELLAGELQVKGAFPDLTQADSINLCATACRSSPLEELIVAPIDHLEQLLELLHEVSVI